MVAETDRVKLNKGLLFYSITNPTDRITATHPVLILETNCEKLEEGRHNQMQPDHPTQLITTRKDR
jgi:hypothetical protein